MKVLHHVALAPVAFPSHGGFSDEECVLRVPHKVFDCGQIVPILGVDKVLVRGVQSSVARWAIILSCRRSRKYSQKQTATNQLPQKSHHLTPRRHRFFVVLLVGFIARLPYPVARRVRATCTKNAPHGRGGFVPHSWETIRPSSL